MNLKNSLFDWENKEILITGGTGSLGKTITKILLEKYHPRGIRIYSRDEYKQWLMRQEVEKWNLPGNIAFLIGNVRDKIRLDRAMKGVDIVFNTAAMKQVPTCEYNPIEAVKTNIDGSKNILDTAIDNKVDTVMHVSTDKAVYPINLYGMTKAVAEKMLILGGVYRGDKGTKFSCCRYGNVLGSRGSIIPLIKKQIKTGKVTVTDKEMTRFWITLDKVANFIIENTMNTKGGEIFIPKMPSMKIGNLIESMIESDTEIVDIGVREGEKLHECLITNEETDYLTEDDNKYIIHSNRTSNQYRITGRGYFSNTNEQWLTKEQLKELINNV